MAIAQSTIELSRKLAANAGFGLSVRKYFRTPMITPAQAEEIVRGRLRDRGKNLLGKIENGVLNNEASPYRKMFSEAGIGRDRVAALIESSGVEGALEEFKRQGIVVPYEDFKALNAGKPVNPDKYGKHVNFNNPAIGSGMVVQSSGSRSAGTRLFLSFSSMDESLPTRLIRESVNGTHGAEIVLYFSILPDAIGIRAVINAHRDGRVISAWFSPIDPKTRPLTYRLSTSYALAAMRLAGAKTPKPTYVPLSDVRPIARWIAERRRLGKKVNFRGYATTSVRVCEAAREEGLDVSGTFFSMVGEPVTQAKCDAVRSAGGIPLVNYGSIDAGFIGSSCPHSRSADDMHFHADSIAMIRGSREVPSFGLVEPFLVTTLLPRSALVLLNVEIDDYGDLSERPCDCLLGRLGLTRRVSNVRSFVKLTTEGMTFVGTNLLGCIETELPKAFGGGPLDYQLLEEEDSRARTRLSLRVSPKVGPIDESAVLNLIYSRIQKSGGGGPLFSDIWREGNAIQVVRQPPVATRAGKVFPFHTLR